MAALMSGPASAVDGNLAVFQGGSGKIVKDGGSPLTWNLAINESGTSLANWTQVSGSWSVVSSAFQVNSGATTLVNLAWTAKIAQSGIVFEADMKIESGGGFGADNRVGLRIDYDGTTGASGAVAFLRCTGALNPASTGVIYSEQPYALTAGPNLTNLFALDTYYKLKIVAIGNVFDVYVDGVYKTTRARIPTNGALEYAFVGLVAYNCIADFKNVKMYSLALP